MRKTRNVETINRLVQIFRVRVTKKAKNEFLKSNSWTLEISARKEINYDVCCKVLASWVFNMPERNDGFTNEIKYLT